MSALAVDPDALRAAGSVLLRRAARLAELADGLGAASGGAASGGVASGGVAAGGSTGDPVVDAALADLVDTVRRQVGAQADDVAGTGVRLLEAAAAYALADGQATAQGPLGAAR